MQALSRQDRYRYVLDYFLKQQPEAGTELHYNSPYELVVAVILSAQCTDKRVNLITPPFFRRFPTVESLACAAPQDVFELIKSCSYPNNKTKNLIGMAKGVVEVYGGKIPDSIDELQKLPGIGRKTANVIASVVYGKPAMAVDTHVFRVAARIGLTSDAKTPLQAEMQLTEYIPENLLLVAHHWLILHGRYVCKARKPNCAGCGLKECCNHYQSHINTVN